MTAAFHRNAITSAIHQAVLMIPKKARMPAYDAACTEWPGAWVAEITDIHGLPARPTGIRLIVREEQLHSGAQWPNPACPASPGPPRTSRRGLQPLIRMPPLPMGVVLLSLVVNID
ncbi:hypothetical protein ACFRAO_40890 [Streptomyces sp. NPDC056656]|uniref:hypothetical protein n=1 Tax=Streptomyces sp. NPDC056656 TaxID=3345895 RepID=UPI0036CF3B95